MRVRGLVVSTQNGLLASQNRKQGKNICLLFSKSILQLTGRKLKGHCNSAVVFCYTVSSGDTNFTKMLQTSFLGTDFSHSTQANGWGFCLFGFLWSSFKISQDSVLFCFDFQGKKIKFQNKIFQDNSVSRDNEIPFSFLRLWLFKVKQQLNSSLSMGLLATEKSISNLNQATEICGQIVKSQERNLTIRLQMKYITQL